MSGPLFSALPEATGLYDPRHEHDACGVAMVATLRGRAGHDIVQAALEALHNLDHRGATGADPLVGDGAGILLQIPDAFFRARVDAYLPPAGSYVAGTAFLPRDPAQRAAVVDGIAELAEAEGLEVVTWRDVPVRADIVGVAAREVMPHFAQLFLRPLHESVEGIALERLAFCLRKRAERDLHVYFPSLSCRTLVYKGMLTTAQLGEFFPDLNDETMATELALVHSRFSTNTFPSWLLPHP